MSASLTIPLSLSLATIANAFSLGHLPRISGVSYPLILIAMLFPMIGGRPSMLTLKVSPSYTCTTLDTVKSPYVFCAASTCPAIRIVATTARYNSRFLMLSLAHANLLLSLFISFHGYSIDFTIHTI